MAKFKCQSCGAVYEGNAYNVRAADGVEYIICSKGDGWAHKVVEPKVEPKAPVAKKPTTRKTQKEEA